MSDDAKYDIIYCLFSVKINDIYAQLCSVMKLNASDKNIALKLTNEEFAHAGLRNYVGVSKVCIMYFYSDIVVIKFLKIYLEPNDEFRMPEFMCYAEGRSQLSVTKRMTAYEFWN